MTRRVSQVLGACLLAGAVLGLAARAGAAGRQGQIEAGPFLGGYVFDDDLELKNSVVLGARGGYWLSERLLGELSLAGVPTKEEHGGDRASLLQSHADLLYHFDLGWPVEPFVAAGLGLARYNADAEGGGDWDFLANYGIGARYRINDWIAARADLRQPVTFGSPKYNLMGTVGVSFLLGTYPPTEAAAPASAAPTASLSASPGTVARGAPTLLSWATENASDVSLDGIGAVPLSGSRSLTPQDSTTYRLVARGPGGTAEASVPVTVTSPGGPPTVSLTATPPRVERGQPTTLSWETRGADEVSLEGVGTVGQSGSRTVTPMDSMLYRLAAKGPGGETQAETRVEVTPPPAPTVTFAAQPGTVLWGERTTLSWAVQNATDVSIEGLGAVESTGSRTVEPKVSTTYRLLAKGPGGTAEASAPVMVELPEKLCISLQMEFDFDKADIRPEYHPEIGRVAEFLKTYLKTTAVIEGHTDNVGTREYSEALSLRRADAVVAYLVDRYGIDPRRLSSKGYGFSKPVADNETPEGRQKNRRIDALIDCAAR
ncbi:MAG: OmpA family protein [Deltaproteobacteria bacterium]|nr:OmpA family protein [Deltaproteobacteria bacterium]